MPTASPVGVPGPDIDHRLSVEIDRERTAAEAGMREKGGETAHREGETWIRGALHSVGQIETAVADVGPVHISNVQAGTWLFRKLWPIR